MSDLPQYGRRSYGAPLGSWQRFGSLRVTTARRVRSEAEMRAIHRDNAGHFAREFAFMCWLDSTVYAAAVNRWIEGCRP
jgi:hypothetical protein